MRIEFGRDINVLTKLIIIESVILMKIRKYGVRLNESRIGCLVEESAANYSDIDSITSSDKAAEIFEKVFDLSNQAQECFCMLALNASLKIAGAFEIFRGTVLSSPIHPREIFQRAILAGAASIIVAHNHPSGSLEASNDDRKTTKRLKEAGNLIGIPLNDHIICANGGYTSLI